MSKAEKNPLEQNAIELEQVFLQFPGAGRPALDNVSFGIRSGQIFALLGPNGAGKTTLVRILATLILPTSGRVKVCGYDVVRDASKARRCIGMCSDSQRSFYFRLTGYQNLEFFGGLTGCARKEIKKRIEDVLDRVDLTEARNKLFMQYSHGMKKRLSLARSLLSNAQVYLMDEPTSGIDPSGAATIRHILEDLRAKGKTVFLTTHNIEEASRISDYVGILKDGKMAALDSPANLKQLVHKKKLTIVLQAPKYASAVADTISKLPMVLAIKQNDLQVEIEMEQDDPVTPVLQMIAQNGIPVETLSEKQATLEDVFLRISDRVIL